MNLEWIIAFAIVFPAFLMALTGSSRLVDYTIWVVALNRGIRRLVDYYINDGFNPLSAISLTPLVVAGCLLFPVFNRMGTLTKSGRRIFMLVFLTVGYGFGIGLVKNGAAAVYSLGEWVSGLSAMAFAATAPVDSRTADRWIKSCGWAGVVVALYGWYQYLTIPVWDAAWVEAVGFVGYLGNLVPTEMAVFSTMNERGPCASFLAWAAIPMMLNRRWQLPGWVIVVLLLSSVILLTMSRTMLIIIGLVIILQPVLRKGKGMLRPVFLALLLLIGFTQGIQYLPGAERLIARTETIYSLQEDGSFLGRLQIFSDGLSGVARDPLGSGLGSSGLASVKVEGASTSVGDSGYIQILAQFGWLGAGTFFFSLWLLWKEMTFRAKRDTAEAFIDGGRAILISCLVFLYVGDIFSGFAIYWVFFGLSLNRLTLPPEDTGLTSLKAFSPSPPVPVSL